MAELKLKNSVDVIAIILAAAALIYSVYEHNQTIKIQKIQTERAIKLELEKEKPYLQISFRKLDSELEKGIVMNNVGSGPARIISFKYYIDEDSFKKSKGLTSWLDENGYLTFSKDTMMFEEINVFDNGYVQVSGRQNEIFFLKQIDSFYKSQARLDMEKLIIEIEYQSLNPFDTKIYYLRFCESFLINNIRNKDSLNEYENIN